MLTEKWQSCFVYYSLSVRLQKEEESDKYHAAIHTQV